MAREVRYDWQLHRGESYFHGGLTPLDRFPLAAPHDSILACLSMEPENAVNCRS